MLDPMGIAAEMGVDPRLQQSLGSLSDALAVPTGEAPEVTLEGAAYLHQIVQQAI